MQDGLQTAMVNLGSCSEGAIKDRVRDVVSRYATIINPRRVFHPSYQRDVQSVIRNAFQDTVPCVAIQAVVRGVVCDAIQDAILGDTFRDAIRDTTREPFQTHAVPTSNQDA